MLCAAGHERPLALEPDALTISAAALHNIPNKRVRSCGMVDITEESKPSLLALSPRSAILPR
jgi:hypothetical protein